MQVPYFGEKFFSFPNHFKIIRYQLKRGHNIVLS
jgi:hypothetical protein